MYKNLQESQIWSFFPNFKYKKNYQSYTIAVSIANIPPCCADFVCFMKEKDFANYNDAFNTTNVKDLTKARENNSVFLEYMSLKIIINITTMVLICETLPIALRSSNPTFTPRLTHFNGNVCLVFSVVPDPFSIPGY